jgi:hypothetical protein
MSKLSDDPEKVAAAFLKDSDMDDTASYLGRGRRHQTMTDAEVQDRWASLFKDWVSGGLGRNQDLEDIRSEQGLRNLMPPYERVLDEVAAMKAMVKERISTNPNLRTAVEDYLERRGSGS